MKVQFQGLVTRDWDVPDGLFDSFKYHRYSLIRVDFDAVVVRTHPVFPS
jgi:hypothetical protein